MKKVIIVEGKNDAARIKQVFPKLDVLITNGSAVSDELIEVLKKLNTEAEIILFLDPDFPGEQIRKKILEHIPSALNVFVNKDDAISKNKKKIGVEHVDLDIIKKLIEKPYESDYHENISFNDLIDLGLTGSPESKKIREDLCKRLKIGYVNAKQLVKRLNMFNITLDKVRENL